MKELKEKFYNWLGMKLYHNSDLFKNVIYGIYYQCVQIPNHNKIRELMDEVLKLKSELNVYKMNELVQFKNEVPGDRENLQEEVKPKKRRKYTKHKEVKE